MAIPSINDSMPVAPLENLFNLVGGAAATEDAALAASITTLSNNLTSALAVRQIRTYKWADATARGAQSGMSEGDTGDQADNNSRYRYDGTAWVVITEDTGWITPTLGAGWTQEVGNPVQYRRKNGIVHLRGRARTAGTTTSIFTFPDGFKPDVGTQPVPFALIGGTATIAVNPSTGLMSLATGATGVDYGFALIQFLAIA